MIPVSWCGNWKTEAHRKPASHYSIPGHHILPLLPSKLHYQPPSLSFCHLWPEPCFHISPYSFMLPSNFSPHRSLSDLFKKIQSCVGIVSPTYLKPFNGFWLLLGQRPESLTLANSAAWAGLHLSSASLSSCTMLLLTLCARSNLTDSSGDCILLLELLHMFFTFGEGSLLFSLAFGCLILIL